MSRTTAVMLQDRLNDIERNICDGIDFRQELNEAYALADELEDENAKLIVKLNAEHIVRQNVEAENAKLLTQLEDVIESMGRVEERCAKLRELVRDAVYARDDADWASIVSTAIALGIEVDD